MAARHPKYAHYLSENIFNELAEKNSLNARLNATTPVGARYTGAAGLGARLSHEREVLPSSGINFKQSLKSIPKNGATFWYGFRTVTQIHTTHGAAW